MARCNGKNCKWHEGFDIPHSAECLAEQRLAPLPEKDPRDLEVLNPNHPAVERLGSADYMKLLVLAMHVMDMDEVIITPETIAHFDDTNGVLCIGNMEDGIHLSVITREEAEKIAADEIKEAH